MNENLDSSMSLAHRYRGHRQVDKNGWYLWKIIFAIIDAWAVDAWIWSMHNNKETKIRSTNSFPLNINAKYQKLTVLNDLDIGFSSFGDFFVISDFPFRFRNLTKF
jgi:hypothetical protein